MNYFKNYFKKSIIIVLIITLTSLINFQPVNAQIIPLKRLAEVEMVLYGQTQELAIIKRVEKLEETLYNKQMKGSLIERSNRIINYILPVGDDNPSLVFLINIMEWTMTNNISQGDIISRLDELEKMVFGKIKPGSLVDRISHLAELILPEGKVPAEKVRVLENTLLRIRLLNKVNSAESQLGQRIDFEVVEDVKSDGYLIIPASSQGTMKVVGISEAGQFGKKGKVDLEFSDLFAIDGTPISLCLGKEAQNENRSQQLAVGASLLGTVILGPIGLIAGYFVKGEEEDIPAGTEIYIQTIREEKVYGLKLQ